MQTSLPDLNAILAAQNEKLLHVEQFAKGATSTVWKVKGTRHTYALKTSNGRVPLADAALDMKLRMDVSQKGGIVARPVSNGTGWMLDRFVEGAHPTRGALPKDACYTLGQTLALLHKVPVTGYGAPRVTRGQIIGTQDTALIGLAVRFTNPLPTIAALNTHPACPAMPELPAVLPPIIAEISAKTTTAQPALCHSDLHERQFLIMEGQLMALLDFGDAVICDPRWDFASLLYFHGPRVLADTLAGYANKAIELRDVHLFSIGIALHHAARSVLPNKSHRLKVATVHLRRTLLYLDQTNTRGV
ncbi:MAG: aminoglycoside phosphotransferase family protein [Paracoccaceae bacterium]